MNILESAIAYCRAGLAVLPAHPSRKIPLAGKGHHGKNAPLPTEEQVRTQCAQAAAICILCGAVSGNVECVDFDDAGSAFPAWRDRLQAAVPGLFERLVIERSPSGGVHVVYRCADPVPGSHHLARDAAGKLLIETRGEGALFLCAPSPRYTLMQGAFEALPVLTPAEREAVLATARALGASLPPPPAPARPVPRLPVLPVSDASPYVMRALEDEAAKVWACPAGGRNRALNTAAVKIGHYVASGLIAEEPVYSILEAAALEAGLNPVEIRPTIHSGLTAGARDPRTPPPRPEPWPDVDLSRLVQRAERVADGLPPTDPPAEPDDDDIDDESDAYADMMEPLPEHLLDAPGFIHDAVEWGMKTNNYPNRPLIFGAALATLATLTARKIKCNFKTRPNIYVLAVATSGVGKDAGNGLATEILQQAGMQTNLKNEFSSGESIEDYLCGTPAVLWLCDEIDSWLSSLRGENGRGGFVNGKLARLLTYFSSSNRMIQRRAKASGERGKPESEVIYHPHISLYGTCTPANFFSAFSERVAAGGFLGRTLIFDAAPRGLRQRLAADPAQVPESLLRVAAYWAAHPTVNGNLGDTCPVPYEVPVTDEANEIDERHVLIIDRDIYPEYQRKGDDLACSVWARAGEYAQKLALLYAASANHENPVIDAVAMQWAWDIMMLQCRRMIVLARRHAAETPFQEQCLKVLNRLQQAKGSPVARSELLRLARVKKQDFEAIIETLIDRGQIVTMSMKSKYKPKLGYALRKKLDRRSLPGNGEG